jgi:hypothetical protein
MKLLTKLCFWRKKTPVKADISTVLNDSLKAELADIAARMKAEHVSVRDLHADEMPSDIPEIGEKPF